MRQSEQDVVLVSMPFASAFSPSIALGLLKAQLSAAGFSARVRYFTLTFAQIMGRRLYTDVAEGGKPSTRELAGAWLFSGALFDQTSQEQPRYVEEILRRGGAFGTATPPKPLAPYRIDNLTRTRARVDDFLDRCVDTIVRDRPRVVGFTSVFQQHVPSLALARRLKAVAPETCIVFGGPNCQGIMGAETVRQFPFVDAAVSGEGDLVCADIVRRALRAESLTGLQGVYARADIDARFTAGRFDSAPMVRELNDLPAPDYTDYFKQFEASRYSDTWYPALPFETSRGCWWGERVHCTFCGLNGSTMTYRSKSPDQALDELTDLAQRYPGCNVEVVDNILDLGYFESFLPGLATKQLDLNLFYETKSNLKKEQIRVLRAAGVDRIQPGVEHFSDAVLTLMGKGVSGLHNIQLLKWCKELGVTPLWNFLWGFPGEPAAAYDQVAALVPNLTHLPPPVGISSIRLDRFSPHFFDAERFGLVDVEPLPSYRHVYALPDEAISNLASYFIFRYRDPQAAGDYAQPALRQLRRWKRVAARSELFSVDMDGSLFIWDLRPGAGAPLTRLDGLDRALYQACDAVNHVGQLARVPGRLDGSGWDAALVSDRLARLSARGLMAADGNRYLALAIPLGEYSPAASAVTGFYEVVSGLGRGGRHGLTVRLDTPLTRVRRRPTRSTERVRARRTASTRSARLGVGHFSIDDDGQLLVRRQMA